jgi:hypothetical protein
MGGPRVIEQKHIQQAYARYKRHGILFKQEDQTKEINQKKRNNA